MTLTEGKHRHRPGEHRRIGQDLVAFLFGDAVPLEERARVERLGQYNAEVQRGILHTPDWDSLMDSEQEWFDDGVV